jgi:hypothetical protein
VSRVPDLTDLETNKMKKKHHDGDYNPDEEFRDVKKRRGGSSGGTKPLQKKIAYSWMDQFAERITKLQQSGAKYSQIALVICTEAKLPQGSITGKQVNNWCNYMKTSKQRKLRPVSAKNNNLVANSNDDCMYYN